MPRLLDTSRWNLDALRAAWEAARPFPHVVLDDLLAPEALLALREDFAREPHWPDESGIHQCMASASPPSRPALAAFAGELAGAEVRAAVEQLCGKTLQTAQARGYVYLPGHYLLPHTDCRPGLSRVVAYAFYLAAECEGGELELFACTMQDGEIVATEPAVTIAPRPNRLVLFDVSPVSLHQIREVRQGARASIAGWFLA